MPPFVEITECEFESNNHGLAISRDAASVELMVKVAGTMIQDVQQFNLFSERWIHAVLRWQDGLPYFSSLLERPQTNLVLLEEIPYDDGTAFGGVSYDLDIDPDEFDRILTDAIEHFLAKSENENQPLTEWIPSCEIGETMQEPEQPPLEHLVPALHLRLSVEDLATACDEPWPLEAGRCECQVIGRGRLIHSGGNQQEISCWAHIDFEYEPQGKRLVFSGSPIGLYDGMVYAVEPENRRRVKLLVPGHDDEDILTWLRRSLDGYFEHNRGRDLRRLLPTLEIQGHDEN